VNNLIQSLWIGTDLSSLERVSIQSFLDHGHQYHLYAYQELANVPAGAVLKDANEIFSASLIFQYSDHKTYAAFSNVFRYKLLLERGGVWADTDVISLRPFDLADEHVFASEVAQRRDGGPPDIIAGTCLIKAPIGSPAMALALEICLSKDWSTVRWGEIGPRLLNQVVAGQGLQRFIQPPAVFCCIGPLDWLRLIDPQPPSLPAEAYALHFWNEMWRLADQDKSAEYPPSCLYERLKRRHLRRTDRGSDAAEGHGVGSRGDIHG
jgi:hypothetical protein